MHNLSFNLCPLELFLPYVYLLLLCILLLSVSVIRINSWKHFSFSVCWGKTWRSSHSTIAQGFNTPILDLPLTGVVSTLMFKCSPCYKTELRVARVLHFLTLRAARVLHSAFVPFSIVSLFCVFVSLFSASPSFGQNHNVFADQTETNYSSFEIKIIKMVYRLRAFVLSRSLLHTQYFESGSPS